MFLAWLAKQFWETFSTKMCCCISWYNILLKSKITSENDRIWKIQTVNVLAYIMFTSLGNLKKRYFIQLHWISWCYEWHHLEVINVFPSSFFRLSELFYNFRMATCANRRHKIIQHSFYQNCIFTQTRKVHSYYVKAKFICNINVLIILPNECWKISALSHHLG